MNVSPEEQPQCLKGIWRWGALPQTLSAEALQREQISPWWMDASSLCLAVGPVQHSTFKFNEGTSRGFKRFCLHLLQGRNMRKWFHEACHRRGGFQRFGGGPLWATQLAQAGSGRRFGWTGSTDLLENNVSKAFAYGQSTGFIPLLSELFAVKHIIDPVTKLIARTQHVTCDRREKYLPGQRAIKCFLLILIPESLLRPMALFFSPCLDSEVRSAPPCG